MSPLTKPIGSPFIELRTVESTNNYAIALIQEGMAQHGLCVFAHEQTKGKGQRQKQWISAPDENILLSILIEPFGLKLQQQAHLNMSVALGVFRFFSRHAGQEVKIKWPNDLYWRDRKAGGILIENSVQGSRWKYAVIGIGLNINQTSFPELATKAVSLKQITGKNFDTVLLAKELIADVQASLEQLMRQPEETSKEYNRQLYKLHQKVKLRKGQKVLEAVIQGVTDQGRLVAQQESIETFSAGEVEWLTDEDA